MSVPETLHAGETPRSAHVKSLQKRIVAVVATFFLATLFALVGAPAATAAPAAMNDHVLHVPKIPHIPPVPTGYHVDCHGESPGWCPPWERLAGKA